MRRCYVRPATPTAPGDVVQPIMRGWTQSESVNMTFFQKRWFPSRETVLKYRWLQWLGPSLNHPRLWGLNRRGIAMGLGLGIFFGLLIPVAQIPFAAVTAVIVRANLPAAVASTLVTNPVTFAPVYYGAYHLGRWVLGKQPATPEQIEAALAERPELDDKASWKERLAASWKKLSTVGKPLVVGLALVATTMGLLVYLVTGWVWTYRTRRNRRQRLARRGPPMRVDPPGDIGQPPIAGASPSSNSRPAKATDTHPTDLR